MDVPKKSPGSLRIRRRISVSEGELPLCRYQDCPLRFKHCEGKYLFKDQPSQENHSMWGQSNPPRWLWRAFDRFNSGIASPPEIEAIISFGEFHSSGGWMDCKDAESEEKGEPWRERTLNGRKFPGWWSGHTKSVENKLISFFSHCVFALDGAQLIFPKSFQKRSRSFETSLRCLSYGIIRVQSVTVICTSSFTQNSA